MGSSLHNWIYERAVYPRARSYVFYGPSWRHNTWHSHRLRWSLELSLRFPSSFFFLWFETGFDHSGWSSHDTTMNLFLWWIKKSNWLVTRITRDSVIREKYRVSLGRRMDDNTDTNWQLDEFLRKNRETDRKREGEKDRVDRANRANKSKRDYERSRIRKTRERGYTRRSCTLVYKPYYLIRLIKRI